LRSLHRSLIELVRRTIHLATLHKRFHGGYFIAMAFNFFFAIEIAI
jgi:hypothetical protein